MYEVQFRRFLAETDYASIGFADTIEQASALRRASGDLVVEASTQKIVTDRSWLWDWEKNSEASYAHAAIRWQERQFQPIG